MRNVDKVLSIGVSLFADSLRQQGVQVVEVSWRPPPELEKDLEDVLDKLL